MANFQDTISSTILSAKLFCKELLTKIIELQANGNDIGDQQDQFIIMHEWILTAQRYYDGHWDSEGDAIDPVVDDCLTSSEMEGLLQKMKQAMGNKTFVVSDWVLLGGEWHDENFWRDSAVWID